MEADLWAIRDGLSMVHSKGIQLFIVETYSTMVIDLLKTNTDDTHPFLSIISSCR